MLMTRPRLGGTIPRSSSRRPKQRLQPEAVNLSTSSRAMQEAAVGVFDRDNLDILLRLTQAFEERLEPFVEVEDFWE